jgi:amino acid transporter
MAVLMSVAAFLTAAPTIARQFELLINAAVVFTLLVYIYASIALVRFTAGASPGLRMSALVLAVLAIGFCILLIVSSGSGLIAVTAGLVVLTLLGWQFVRGRAD